MSAADGGGTDEVVADARGPRRWWRRNALWLVAALLLVPATAGGIAWHELTEQVESTQWRETRVLPGAQIELVGTSLGPASSEEPPAYEGIEQPPGTRIVIVTLPVRPGAAPFSCLTPTLIEQGTGREWLSTYAPLGWEGESGCYEATAPLVLRVPYVVPADAGPFELELRSAGLGDERLPRFVLEPH